MDDNKNKIFIEIVLYLLLAFAFFEKYFTDGDIIGSTGPLIFILGIISLIFLTLIYLGRKEDNFLSCIVITPFILMLLFILIRVYYFAIEGTAMTSGFSGFVNDFIKLIWGIICMESILVISSIILFMFLIYAIKDKIKNFFKKIFSIKNTLITIIIILTIIILILIRILCYNCGLT